MLLNAIKPLGIWFGTGGASMEEGSPLDRNVLVMLALMGMIILGRRGFSWFNALRDNLMVFLLLAYMLISVLWSDMPFVSLKRWIREFIAIIMAFVIATELNPIGALMSICRRTIYIIIPFSYILIHYFPHLGRRYNRWFGEEIWIGVATAKNGLVLICIFAIYILVCSSILRRQGQITAVTWYHPYVEYFLIVLAIWLFMGPDHSLTYSSTSLVTLIVGLSSLLGFHWMHTNNKLIRSSTLSLIAATIIVLGTAASFCGGLMMSDVAIFLNRNATLTGRTDIWAYLVPYAMSNPIGGHGFGGFWTEVHREATSSHAHNGYLDIVLNIGFLGLIIFSVYLLDCCRKAHKVLIHDFHHGCLWICILLMILVHNMAESSVTSFIDFWGSINLFMLLSTSNRVIDDYST